MQRSAPAVRIFPMSGKVEGFRQRTIEQVQQHYFLNRIPADRGRFRYRTSGLNTVPGTIVLFQFRARIIALAVFIRDEKLERPRKDHNGVLHFEPGSFRTFDPVDAETLRKAWPRFRAFGHVKQALNPAMYPAFKRHLKNIRAPAGG